MKSKKISYFKYSGLFFTMIVLVLVAGCSGTTPTTPVINSFSADPATITEGESSTLSWSVTDATTVTIDQSVGSVASIGTTTVSPTTTTTYTLTATNTAGSVTTSIIIAVGLAFGSIDIDSSPTGAKVYLDGVDTGRTTPTVFNNVVTGDHTVRLYKYHYKIQEDSNVSVNSGETTYLDWSLTFASQQTITLQPGLEGKDSDVSEIAPNTNSGSYTALYSGDTTSSKKWRAYLQFDLSAVPEGAVVTNAELNLYQYNSLGTGSFILGLYQVTSDWGEDTITWNSQPTSSTAVGDRSAFVSAGFTGWKRWEYLDCFVEGWLDGSNANYGMLLKATDEASITMMVKFRSSDYTADTSKCPKLKIFYHIP